MLARWTAGLKMNARYTVLDLLGDGTFGRVVLAEDLNRRRNVAIKVIRNAPHSENLEQRVMTTVF